MSAWQQYVDERLVRSKNVRSAAIIGADDGATWAESSGGLLKDGEGAAIVALFKDPGEVFISGVVVGGEKYKGIKGDEKAICAHTGASGVALVKTARTIVVGHYEEGEAPCSALLSVEKVADLIRANGD
jgi:profilin